MNEPFEATQAGAKVRRSLENLASRISQARSARDGEVMLRLSGEGGGTYMLSRSGDKVDVVDSAVAGFDRPPLLEVMGDAQAVRSILDGEADAREVFFSGGLRIRGNLRLFSDVALELGLLKEPL